MFHFKQFDIRQDRCAMKVGTDGVLVGAWTPIDRARRILDIGTGSGLIALMAAQRNAEALIDAVEMEPGAAAQAADNVAASPWAGRIAVHAVSIQTFTEDFERRGDAATPYDAVVSNPPFFDETTTPPDDARAAARHTATLPFAELMRCAATLLAAGGTFSLIHPATAADAVAMAAATHGLTCVRHCDVRTAPRKAVRRILATYQKPPLSLPFRREALSLRAADGTYSEEYISLTQAFYTQLLVSAKRD